MSEANDRLRSALRLLDVPVEGEAAAQMEFRNRQPGVLRRQMESAAREIRAALGGGDPGLRTLVETVLAGVQVTQHNGNALDNAIGTMEHTGKVAGHWVGVMLDYDAVMALGALRDALALSVPKKARSS